MIRLILIAIVCLELSACVTNELYCSGTLQQDGTVQTEPSSLSLVIDAYNKTVTVDNYEPVQWRETTVRKVVFFNTIRDDMPGVRTGEFDRRTGRLTVFLNRGDLVVFKGFCERASIFRRRQRHDRLAELAEEQLAAQAKQNND
jgi:hypothetical protein